MLPASFRSLVETVRSLGAYDFAPGSLLTLMPERIDIH
jgi:hypothetical protein